MAFISSGCPPTPVFLPVTLPAEQRVSRSAQRAASLIAQACAKSLTAKDRPRTRGRRPSSCPQSSRLSCWLSWPAAPRSRPFETSARAALHSSVPLAATAITHARRGRANGSVLYAPYTACAAPPTLRCARHTNSTSFAAHQPAVGLTSPLLLTLALGKRKKNGSRNSFPNLLPAEQVVTWKV